MRRNIYVFRISAYRLQIERGRYTGMKIYERLCTCTKCYVIEDESHFLFMCKKYDSIRKDMYKIIKYSNTVLGSCTQENLIKLFNCIDLIVIKAIGKSLKQSYVFREVCGLRHLVLQIIYELSVACVFVKATVLFSYVHICTIAFNPMCWVQVSNELF